MPIAQSTPIDGSIAQSAGWVSLTGWPWPAKTFTSVAQNAGRSSGLRLVMSVFGPDSQTWTSVSVQLPPAFLMSVFRLGQDVSVRPRTRSASTAIHGPWQMIAAGLRASNIRCVNRTAPGAMRSMSPLATPPGTTIASYSVGSVSCSRPVHGKGVGRRRGG